MNVFGSTIDRERNKNITDIESRVNKINLSIISEERNIKKLEEKVQAIETLFSEIINNIQNQIIDHNKIIAKLLDRDKTNREK